MQQSHIDYFGIVVSQWNFDKATMCLQPLPVCCRRKRVFAGRMSSLRCTKHTNRRWYARFCSLENQRAVGMVYLLVHMKICSFQALNCKSCGRFGPVLYSVEAFCQLEQTHHFNMADHKVHLLAEKSFRRRS